MNHATVPSIQGKERRSTRSVQGLDIVALKASADYANLSRRDAITTAFFLGTAGSFASVASAKVRSVYIEIEEARMVWSCRVADRQ